MDLPARVLAWATRWMPEERSEWRAAMESELTQIKDPLERWRFALGGTRAAMFTPGRSNRILALVSGAKSTLDNHPSAEALIGLLFILPFGILNAIVAGRVEPFFSFIRPGPHTSTLESILLPAVLLLLPLGAYCAMRPLLRSDSGGRRRFYLLNAAIAALMLIVFAVLTAALGAEIYACEVMQVSNCD